MMMSATTAAVDNKPNRLSSGDASSFSRPDEVQCIEMALDVFVNFATQTIEGTVTYQCQRNVNGADVLILDAYQLSIKRAYCTESSQELQYTVSDPVGEFGSRLQIVLLPSFSDQFSICVEYSTSPDAGGLQWLTPEQTAGKKRPYMFSQFQPIYARSMMPCQDTPAIKMPYRAKIRVPEGLVVLMSAVSQGSSVAPNGQLIYEFHQQISIPSYLLAIAVGDLVSKKIGPRSKVWTEREMLDAAAYEFGETEEMLAAAEDLCGDYVWGVYDLLVLPPSFPYGGMENPCLTFVTPTLLAGDRSSSSTVAHEIAHSWTGNLVSNKNWEHFWLNEGHTVFIERKIVGRLYGEKHRQFHCICGWTNLLNAIEKFGASNHLTDLVVCLNGVHPDDAFSSVPYEKGSCLLYYLEGLLGGADSTFVEAFEPWLKAYLKKFSGKSITTEEWKDFLYSFFCNQHDVLNKIDWQGWLFAPGMPPVKPDYDYSLFDACLSLCNLWLSEDSPPDDSKEFDKFSTKQKIEFLSQLLLKDPMPEERIKQLGDLYKLQANNNAEIKCRWLQLCMRGGLVNMIEDALQFVTETGRMKFVRPLYRDMYNFESARQQAIQTFTANKSSMHHISSKMVAEELHLAK